MLIFYFNIKNNIEINNKIYTICGFIIKDIFRRNENLNFLYLDENFNFKCIDFGQMFCAEQHEENLKIFAKRNELILLYYLFNTDNQFYHFDENEEKEYKENILKLILKREEYNVLEESMDICRKINPIGLEKQNANIELEINYKKEITEKLDILETNNIIEIKEYIKNNWILENATSIKNFIEYIEKYSFKKELENLFIDKIIYFVEEKLSPTYSLKKLLSYFDGSIIFNNKENNKLYENLRLRVFETNKVFIKFIKDNLLYLEKDDKELCNSFKIFKNFNLNIELLYNRNHYANMNLEEENFNNYKTLTNILKKNIQCINEYIKGNDIVKALNYFIFVIKNKIKEEKYNYSLVISKEYNIGFINSIKFICLFTGIKFELMKESGHTYKSENLIGVHRSLRRERIELKNNQTIQEIKNKRVKLFISFAITEENIYNFPSVEDIFRFQQNVAEDTYLINIHVAYGTNYLTSVEYNSLEKIDSEKIESLSERKSLIIFIKNRIHRAHWNYHNRYVVTIYNKNGVVKYFDKVSCLINNLFSI